MQGAILPLCDLGQVCAPLRPQSPHVCTSLFYSNTAQKESPRYKHQHHLEYVRNMSSQDSPQPTSPKSVGWGGYLDVNHVQEV